MALRATLPGVLAGSVILLSALTVSTASNAGTVSNRCHVEDSLARSSCCYRAEGASLWQRVFGSTCISQGGPGHERSAASSAGTKSNSAPSNKGSSSGGGSTGSGSGSSGGGHNGGGNDGSGGGNNGGGNSGSGVNS
ncbi:hypothetical protein FZC33_15885 [Labrys sp. KNU-23]|uniref:hypothetical protein n=1 Tax=Labrys sp. KNU-23 TaxID=2789216 RepID=UPI0011EEB0C0|nr:hypothetical protein [Labrys sp. KNU-23]QEN87707.1 hypothetical protein FZC33_15885 [Labrys sp. KNU-23]